jgi:Cu/Zn superoxide dismutase
LYKASPEEADRLFLRLMIVHHRAAIPMAEAILKRTDRPEVRQLAEAIKTSQQGEIQTMQGMLRDRVGSSIEVKLKPQNGSHVTGTATLTESDGGVRVELRLRGLPKANTIYLAHIHPGACSEGEEGAEDEEEDHHEHSEHGSAAGEEIEWPLSEVQSDAQGHGLSTTTLKDASMEQIFTGEFKHLNVHAAGSGDPPVLACAELY